jgi:hypothetical protein
VKEVISCFYIPIARDPEICRRAESRMANLAQYPWDTSVMKVIDDLLIGLRKCSTQPQE